LDNNWFKLGYTNLDNKVIVGIMGNLFGNYGPMGTWHLKTEEE